MMTLLTSKWRTTLRALQRISFMMFSNKKGQERRMAFVGVLAVGLLSTFSVSSWGNSSKTFSIGYIQCEKIENVFSTKISSGLYPFANSSEGAEKCGSFGFIDSKLNVVIPAKYQDVRSFNGDLAAVKIYEKWIYIDKLGKVAFSKFYDEARSFNNGLAFVQSREDKFFLGYINQTGRVIIDLSTQPGLFDQRYQTTEFMDSYQKDFRDFSDGVIVLNLSNHRGLKLNKKFPVIDINTPASIVANESYCSGKPKSSLNTSAVVIDSKGLVKSLGKFTLIMPFSEGLAYSELERCDGKSVWRGFSDKNGNRVIDLTKTKKMGDISRITNGFHEGLADFRSETTGKRGFINRSGKWVIAPIYEEASFFSDGFANVSTCKIKIKYCDDYLENQIVTSKGTLLKKSPATSSFKDARLPFIYVYNEDRSLMLGMSKMDGELVWKNAGTSSIKAIGSDLFLSFDSSGGLVAQLLNKS